MKELIHGSLQNLRFRQHGLGAQLAHLVKETSWSCLFYRENRVAFAREAPRYLEGFTI